MKYKLFKRLLLVITLGAAMSNSTTFSKDIFFDLGGVLIRTSKSKAIPKLGFKCIFYPNYQTELFDFLNFIDNKHDNPADAAATYLGTPLPPLFCKWQKGKLTCKQTSDYIIEHVDKNPDYFAIDGYTGKTKKELIKNGALLILPENTAEIIKVIPNMLKLVKDLKNEKDENGKPKHKLGIISNYDWETIQLLKKTIPELFGCFEEKRIIISSKVGMIKPNKDIFDYTRKELNLSNNPKDNIFIDDQIENSESSSKNGFTGIRHINANKTRLALKKLGILSKPVNTKK